MTMFVVNFFEEFVDSQWRQQFTVCHLFDSLFLNAYERWEFRVNEYYLLRCLLKNLKIRVLFLLLVGKYKDGSIIR